jgi:ABC transport system ATP-binding/permease protein
MDADLYVRDPVLFDTTTFALAGVRNKLTAAEEQWLTLEMRRGEIEGV